MAENRYSVDDILKELNSKQRVGDEFNSRPAAEPSQSPAPRRPAAPPSRREWEPVAPPTSRRPLREPPAGVREAPRLGQNLQPPRDREEMGRLLNNFDDEKSDPLGDLGFLSREPDLPVYEDTPAHRFVPDWDKQNYQGAPTQRPMAPARRDYPSREEPSFRQRPQPQPQPRVDAAPQSRRDYAEPPRTQRPAQEAYDRSYENPPKQPAPPRREAPTRTGYPYEAPRSAPPERGDPYDYREPPQRYQTDRRSMADAARMITTGGFDDLPPQQQPLRGRSQVPYEAAPAQRRAAAPSADYGQTAPRRQQPQPEAPNVRQSDYEAPRPTRSAPPPRQRTGSAMPGPDDIFGTPEPSRTPPRREQPAPTPPREERTRQEEAPETGSKRTGNPQVAQQLRGMRTSLLIRVVINLITLMGVVYLALAADYKLPLPGFIDGAEHLAASLWCTVGLVIVSAVVSGNTVGGGMLALLRLRPSNDSYSALAVFACLIQGAYMAMQPQLMADYGAQLYLPMAALMLLFNTLGKLIMLSRIGGSFSFIAAKGEKHVADIMDNREFARRISGDMVGEEAHIAYFTDSLEVEGFLEQAFSESKAEDISKMVAPMTALAALVMALTSYLFSRDIFVSACVYTAALCITAPLAGVIASHLPLSITNGKLTRFGAALCGYDAVSRFADVNGVLLRCSQLFPKGSVAIQDIKVLDRRPIDQVILDAASVLCACDSDLTGIFRDMVPDAGILPQPENLEYYDDMGISAWVNGRRVLIGNRGLMMSFGVSIPEVDFERPYTTGNNEVLYLANSGEAAAMYVLTYRADKQMRRAMELLCDRDMAVCVYSTDPNLTADKISAIYSFPKELISIIPASMQPGCERYMGTKGRGKVAVIHNGSPASYLRTILAAQSCSRCITLETALLLLSVVLGFGIVTFFAFTRQMEALTWVTIAVYQFFWLLIELVVPLMKH